MDYAARSDQGCATFPQRCTKTLKKKPTEYLKQLYYDSMVFTPEGLAPSDAERVAILGETAEKLLAIKPA